MPLQLLLCCLLVWKEKSSSQRRQITCSFAYFLYYLLEVEGIAGGRRAGSADYLCMLPVSVARGQLGCPLAVWDCKMDWTACGLCARAPGELARRSNGARSQARALLPSIQQAVLSCLSELAGFSGLPAQPPPGQDE